MRLCQMHEVRCEVAKAWGLVDEDRATCSDGCTEVPEGQLSVMVMVGFCKDKVRGHMSVGSDMCREALYQ